MCQLNLVHFHEILEMPLLVLIFLLTFSLCNSSNPTPHCPKPTLQGLVQRKVTKQATCEKEDGFFPLLFHVLNWILVIST